VLRIGLTGGIGSGKSEVTRRLARRGAVVIDADLLAREVIAPGSDGLAALVRQFGDHVLGADGSVDRAALAAEVFADDGRRRALEAIIHPRVRARAGEIEALAASDAIVVHDIPLLVETGQSGAFDVVVVVDVPEEMQVRRVVHARDMTPEQAWSRITAQAARTERLAAADLVVDNTGTLEDLDERVDRLWEALVERSGGEIGVDQDA
jgi:dephospho-CoA kinase